MGKERKTPVCKCKYNSGGVDCPYENRDCAVCGWNPDVKEARAKLLRRAAKYKHRKVCVV